MEYRITDKYGRFYQLTVSIAEEIIRLNLYDRSQFAGYSNLGLYTSGQLDLADIRIRPHYRNRGLGTIIIRQISDIARQQSIQVIRGFVVNNDLDENPHLLLWYERRGFTVSGANEEDRAKPFQEDAVALLYMELR